MLSTELNSRTIVVLLVLVLAGCSKQDQQAQSEVPTAAQKETLGIDRYDSYVVQKWYELLLQLIKETPGHTPPVAARTLGYTGVALYESLVGEMPHHSLVGQLQGLQALPKRRYGYAYSAPLVANSALGTIINSLFGNASLASRSKIEMLETSIEQIYSPGTSDPIVERSNSFGRDVAEAIFDWSKTDGGYQGYLNNFPTDYTPATGIDKWVPTPPLYQSAMLPYWGQNRTMVEADNTGLVDPPSPPEFSTSPGSVFFDAANEVYNAVNHLTVLQRNIALYWADGANTFTPPGHNAAIALQMIRNRRIHLYEATILLAKLGVAENDAAIVCWRAKFRTNLLRPFSFIRSYIDARWVPLISTPPFPSYISGHSSFSGAAAAILSSEIGNRVSFVDSSKVGEGFQPRAFSDFDGAANEAAISRLYGGIHYSFDNRNGLKCGADIAANVQKLNW